MKRLRRLVATVLLAWVAVPVLAQVVEFESGGLQYQTLTLNGLTVMFSHLPDRIRQYGILQVAVSNGSAVSWTIRPDDFRLELQSGRVIRAVPALRVINELVEYATGDDVISLVTAYEASILGARRIQASRGFEQRRQTYILAGSPRRIMAAAAASAIAFVETTLQPGESTDGAVFYPVSPDLAGESTLKVSTDGNEFVFDPSQPIWASQ